ncbi:hypothetical protein [Virgibacillus kimchii]
MKKKLTVLTLVVVFVIGAGNAVYANSNSGNDWSFEEMLPFMNQMHPEMNDQELEQMYQNCHGSNNEMPRMNRF